MVAQLSASVAHASRLCLQAPLRILRTETVLSRFPIHNLTTHGRVSIHLQRTNAQGDFDYLWDVSTSAHHGPPGPLAYKLDTLVINRLLDALPRPVPSVLKVGSLRQVAPQLALNTSGCPQEHLKHAFHQNASAYIVTKLRYRDRDGRQRRLEAGFTRYSVVFQGERLPDSTPADAIYLVLREPFRELLNHAPVRPLDYTYLQALRPMAQRFYELLSYHMFATLTHRRPHATLRYGEYCLLATQQRYTAYEQVKKQMNKVHRPHLAAAYIAQVRSTATTDADGQPDWLLHYAPGPQVAQTTRYDPQVFGGILHYTDRALEAYDARAALGTHATTRQAAVDERTQREQYRTWEQQQLAGLRAALPSAEFAALEEASRARLVAEGTPANALRMGVQAAVDQVLAAQAGLPTFEAWRARQEAGR